MQQNTAFKKICLFNLIELENALNSLWSMEYEFWFMRYQRAF